MYRTKSSIDNPDWTIIQNAHSSFIWPLQIQLLTETIINSFIGQHTIDCCKTRNVSSLYPTSTRHRTWTKVIFIVVVCKPFNVTVYSVCVCELHSVTNVNKWHVYYSIHIDLLTNSAHLPKILDLSLTQL